jgi:hypothetical protein
MTVGRAPLSRPVPADLGLLGIAQNSQQILQRGEARRGDPRHQLPLRRARHALDRSGGSLPRRSSDTRQPMRRRPLHRKPIRRVFLCCWAPDLLEPIERFIARLKRFSAGLNRFIATAAQRSDLTQEPLAARPARTRHARPQQRRFRSFRLVLAPALASWPGHILDGPFSALSFQA